MDFIYLVDRAVADFMVSIQNGFLNGFFEFFTRISEAGLCWIVLGISLLINKKTRKMGVYFAFSLAVAFLLSEHTIKDIVCRERPFIDNESIKLLISPPGGYSFPSSHTASSFACAVSLILCNKKAGISALVIAAIIAVSRIYFTVHFLTDVLVGAALGSAVAILVHIVIDRIAKAKKAE